MRQAKATEVADMAKRQVSIAWLAERGIKDTPDSPEDWYSSKHVMEVDSNRGLVTVILQDDGRYWRLEVEAHPEDWSGTNEIHEWRDTPDHLMELVEVKRGDAGRMDGSLNDDRLLLRHATRFTFAPRGSHDPFDLQQRAVEVEWERSNLTWRIRRQFDGLCLCNSVVPGSGGDIHDSRLRPDQVEKKWRRQPYYNSKEVEFKDVDAAVDLALDIVDGKIEVADD